MAPAPPKRKPTKPLINADDLARTFADQHGLTPEQGQMMLKDLTGLITKHFKQGERVTIAGLGVLRSKPAKNTPAPPPKLVSLVEVIGNKLGGRQALGTNVSSDADLARLVRRGIGVSVLDHLSKAGFSNQEIGYFIIPARTLRHRKIRKEPLTLDESDRVVRFARIQSLAEDVLGDVGKANQWLRQGLGILDGKTPLDVARTEAGGRVVEQILAKIDWGAAA
jgi:putative toxin-antitoxin system antitoxin component (TIGR02293 family)